MSALILWSLILSNGAGPNGASFLWTPAVAPYCQFGVTHPLTADGSIASVYLVPSQECQP